MMVSVTFKFCKDLSSINKYKVTYL